MVKIVISHLVKMKFEFGHFAHYKYRYISIVIVADFDNPKTILTND